MTDAEPADEPSNDLAPLMDAGGAAVPFNAPMDRRRARALAGQLADDGARSIVDLGCGRGAMARLVAEIVPTAAVLGVDLDEAAIAAAGRAAVESGFGDRLRYEVADAATWSGPVDAAVCIGASHALDGPAGLLTHLADLVPGGTALVGDAVWAAEPDDWCRETFGTLPDGPGALVALATRAGWSVASVDTSSLAEWDEFERGWVAGVRSVGTEAATTFADERAAEYERYRGILGFAWLHLRR